MREIKKLCTIRILQSQKVIVDTNIPIDILQKIADYHQVAIMVTPQAMSVESFLSVTIQRKFLLRNKFFEWHLSNYEKMDIENGGELIDG